MTPEEVLALLVAERFGPVPYPEKPQRYDADPKVIAARRRVLVGVPKPYERRS